MADHQDRDAQAVEDDDADLARERDLHALLSRVERECRPAALDDETVAILRRRLGRPPR